MDVGLHSTHMWLQSIVGQLDIELNRLYNLRNIVAGLASIPVSDNGLVLTPEALPSESSEPVLESSQPVGRRHRVRIARRTRPSVKQAVVAEATALQHAIPVGPVVISAEQLMRERQARLASQTQAQTASSQMTDLEALSRDLAARWTARIF